MFITSILLLLLSNAVTLRRDLSIFFNRIAIIVLFYAILLETLTFFILSKGIGLHGGLLQVNNLTQLWHSFLFIISILILQLTSFYPRKIWITQHSSFKNFFKNFLFFKAKIFSKKEEQFKIVEYPLILLFIISGAILLMSTKDFVSIFLSIELQSYGLYLVCTIYRNSELSTTGGLMYFFLGGLSSCFILLGTSLLYANSGTTNLDNLYIITTISDLTNSVNSWYSSNYIHFSLLIFSIGFLFKVGAAPFHFWSPDVYDVIPTIVTTFVAIIAKISILVFLLELVYYTSDNFDLNIGWTYTLLVSSLLSLIIGTVLGLTQFRIKRLFAYSTISHLGFILLALAISNIESSQAFIFYLMQYSISNLNAFVLLIAIGYSLFYYTNNNQNLELIDKNNSPLQLISQLRGYFYVNPFLALSFTITIFSFVGIPPLLGFFAKQMVLSAALNNGYVFLSLIAILTSVIGAVYYLNLIKEMFFYKSDYKLNQLLVKNALQSKLYNIAEGSVESVKYNNNNIILSSPIAITISAITLVILLFMFINKEWLSMSTILVQFIFNC